MLDDNEYNADLSEQTEDQPSFAFDPASLSGLKAEDGEPMFTDEQIKGLSKFAGEEGQPKLAKGYLELEKQFRGKALAVPGEDATDEQRTQFADKVAKILGCPDKPEGYEIARPQLPEGMVYDEGLETTIRNVAHQNKLSTSAVSALAKAYNEHRMAEYKAIMDEQQKAADALVKEWGADAKTKLGDGQNIGTVRRACMAISQILGLDYKDAEGKAQSQLVDCLELTRLGDKVPIVKVFDWLWTNVFQEGKSLGAAAATGGQEHSEGDPIDAVFTHPTSKELIAQSGR